MLGKLIGLIISVAILVAGGFLLYRKTKHSKTVQGLVSQTDCGKALFFCEATVAYTVDTVPHTTNVETTTNSVKSSPQVVNVHYDPKNPRDIILDNYDNKIIGGLIAAGVVIFLLVTIV